jgi:signal peptidase II
VDSADAEPGADPEPSGPGPAEPVPSEARNRTPLIFLTAAIVVVLDQLTKSWAVNALTNGREIDVVGSLRFSLHYNTGASFSMARNLGPIIGVLAIIVVIVLAIRGRGTTRVSTAIVLGLLIGGALGNLCDRLFRSGLGHTGFLHGAVVDFIDPQFWPVFNVADMAVSVGAVLLIILSFLPEHKHAAAADGPTGAGSP